MPHLFLEDLEGYSEDEVKQHLLQYYASTGGVDDGMIASYLDAHDVMIAYESLGAFGCDSTAHFLFRHKITGEYQELMASHFSDCGFDGQFEPQDVSLDFLKSNRFRLKYGGYDEYPNRNRQSVDAFIDSL